MPIFMLFMRIDGGFALAGDKFSFCLGTTDKHANDRVVGALPIENGAISSIM